MLRVDQKVVQFVALLLGLLLGLWAFHVTPVAAQANIPITITTPADLTGTGTAFQMSTITCTGRWVQFIAPSTNSASLRVGDSNTSSSRGTPIAPGAGFMWPPASNVNFIYSPGSYFFYGASGDKLNVTCGQ